MFDGFDGESLEAGEFQWTKSVLRGRLREGICHRDACNQDQAKSDLHDEYLEDYPSTARRVEGLKRKQLTKVTISCMSEGLRRALAWATAGFVLWLFALVFVQLTNDYQLAQSWESMQFLVLLIIVGSGFLVGYLVGASQKRIEK